MRPVYVAGLIGTILSPAADQLSVDADGCLRLDVRIMAELDDGAVVYMACRGRIWFRVEMLPLLTSHEAAAEVDSSRHYMRVAPFFETASEKYRWPNHFVAVGTGSPDWRGIRRLGGSLTAYGND
jgi:hypothetical protein